MGTGRHSIRRPAGRARTAGTGRVVFRFVAAAAALAVLLSGCGSGAETTTTTATAPNGEDPTTQVDTTPTTPTTDEPDSQPTPAGNEQDPTAGTSGGQNPTSSEAARAEQNPDRPTRQRRSKPSSQPSGDSDYVELPAPAPAPSPRRAPRQAKKAPRTFYVARVIDGDTVELGNGQGVRLVGIDTPERGECGFDTATANLVRLVEGKRVRLTQPDEDTDRYGRLLRYLNIGDLDPGLRLIKNGLAIARYDSRDGYGYHPREPTYIAADKATRNRGCAAPAPTRPKTAPKKPAGNCAAGYAPCIPSYPPDVNCADVTGPITVRGSDPHELDADGDGIACE